MSASPSSASRPGPVRCFRCWERGHTVKYCSKPKKACALCESDYCGGGYDERKCAVYREDWTDALEGKSAILNKHRIANLRARLGVDAEMRGVASTLRDGLPELAKEISDAERKLAALKRKRDEVTAAIREAEGMS